MPVLQSFWLFIAAVSVLIECFLYPLAMLPTLCAIAVSILVARRIFRRSGSRLPARLSLIRRRTGTRFRITDDAGGPWILEFLPCGGTDLDVRDPIFATGYQNRRGEFHAVSVTNIRTGARHQSRWVAAMANAATCVVIIALALSANPATTVLVAS